MTIQNEVCMELIYIITKKTDIVDFFKIVCYHIIILAR